MNAIILSATAGNIKKLKLVKQFDLANVTPGEKPSGMSNWSKRSSQRRLDARYQESAEFELKFK